MKNKTIPVPICNILVCVQLIQLKVDNCQYNYSSKHVLALFRRKSHLDNTEISTIKLDYTTKI